VKQKDIAMIIVIAFISGVISLVVSQFLFTPKSNRQQKVEVVPAITASFPSPDNHYFNNSSVDPTQLIQIGNNNNANPFNGTGQ
jgi:hypothetical protein